jgi:peptidoglycan/LPS O-acetylase OafA/YrhL
MNDRFENINLLRAFAATAVVVYHVVELTSWKTFPATGPLVTFRIGWIGVDLFFVISGFVITASALALYQRGHAEFHRKYWIRRLCRIVPLYLLTGALWIALFDPAFFRQPVRDWIGSLAAHVTFTHTFWASTFDSIDGVNWTLGIEMQFYLLISLTIPWIARTAGWRIWIYCVLVAWAWRATMFYVSAPVDAHSLFMRVIQLPGTLDEFGAGIFLAKTMRSRSAPRVGSGLAWTGAAAVAGVVCMSLYWPHADYWDKPGMVIFWRTSLGAFFLCAVGAAVHLPSYRRIWPLGALHYVGEVSYGVYLWHLFAIELWLHVGGFTSSEVLMLTLGLTLVLASVSWHFFERPILEFGRKLSELKAPPVSNVVVAKR